MIAFRTQLGVHLGHDSRDSIAVHPYAQTHILVIQTMVSLGLPSKCKTHQAKSDPQKSIPRSKNRQNKRVVR